MTRSGLGLVRLIEMVRWPEPGLVKKRLVPHLSEAEAASLYADLASHCTRRMRAAAISVGERLEVRVAGGSTMKARRWLGYGLSIRSQRGSSLGNRLAHALRQAFAEGNEISIAVGSDCPGLGGREVREAVRRIREGAQVVLGPASDGGYYLIAIAAKAAEDVLSTLLEDPGIPWGAPTILEDTLRRASSKGLRAELLSRELPDIDRPEDIEIWERIVSEAERMRSNPTIAVVIPAIDESEWVAAAIASARQAGAHEVIVVDGGSADDTAARAREAGAAVVESDRGRATQMNTGAQVATADALCFLHADTLLPPDACEQIRRALRDQNTSGGAFRYGVTKTVRATDSLNQMAGDLRHTVFGIPYGDQAIFLRRQDFDDLGRFTEIPVMEDYELAMRMREFGHVATATSRVAASARDWHDHGLVRTTATNMAVIAGYRMGINTERLARWRRRVAR